jgi:hypothetical protein
MSTKGLVYLVGLVPLGLSYYFVRRYVGNDLAFVAIAVAYLVALRLVAEHIGRKSRRDIG